MQPRYIQLPNVRSSGHRRERCHILLDVIEQYVAAHSKGDSGSGAKLVLQKPRPRLMVFIFLNGDTLVFLTILKPTPVQ